MRNYQSTRTDPIPRPKAWNITTTPRYVQGGPFCLVPRGKDGFSLGGTSVISIGAYGSLQLYFDITGVFFKADPNQIIYFQILFENGIPTNGNRVFTDVGSPLPMTEYINGKIPSPKNTKAVNIRICRTEEYRSAWEIIYGTEGAIALYNENGSGRVVIVRELFQSVQIIQTCFGFIATSAVSSFPIIVG